MGMKCMMGKGQMMSKWKEQDAELDELVGEKTVDPSALGTRQSL
jgi:hypothetical protein